MKRKDEVSEAAVAHSRRGSKRNAHAYASCSIVFAAEESPVHSVLNHLRASRPFQLGVAEEVRPLSGHQFHGGICMPLSAECVLDVALWLGAGRRVGREPG